INTCGFTGEAKEESIGAILGAAGDYPAAELLVMGCLVQRYRHELASGLPEVSGWYGLGEMTTLVDVLTSTASPAQGPPLETPARARRSFAYVKISDGCDHRCSFCAIPGIKGPYAALPPDEIMEQARAALDEGARELVLVGQDTAIWRSEGLDLAGLLDALAADERVRWIRMMYLQPENVDDGLLATLALNDKVVKYLDVPFQHASGRVLRRMARAGDGAGYLALLDRARGTMPDVSVRTTFIVGFPGESEADFATLLDFCASASFDHGGAFVYSPEEGTPASRLRPRIAETVARDRLGRLSSALLSRAEQANTDRVGRAADVMIDTLGAPEGPEGVVAVGRTARQAPEVDGVTFLEGDLPLGAGPGDLVRAVVTEACGYDLVARCDACGEA
ncbi:MAG: MiaB/RimO family radical SAM methylthiotransferase, partial [Thermoleophilia bacterium]|nr:MiaB/RimO family radical SAM methylthiotransferase [Thermoleophilia bacterium]